MKNKLTKFLEVEASELKPLLIITIISTLLSPIIYKIVFAPARVDEITKKEEEEANERKIKTYYGGTNPLD